MAGIRPVISQIIMLFIIAGLGLFLRRIKLLTDPVIKGINRLVLSVTTPAMVLMVTQKEYRPEMMKGFAQVLIVGIVAMSVGCLGAFALYGSGKRKSYQSVAAMLSGMPNAAYIGLPIINAAYGSEGTLFLAAYIIAFNLVEWTLAVALFEGFQLKALKNVINPGFIATIVGTLLYMLKIALPAPLLSATEQLGAVNTPLSLLLLGARMEQLRPKQLLNLHLWIPCLLRLLVIPLCTLGVCRLIGMDGMAMGIAVLSTGMPAAVASQLFAERYDREVTYASVGVSVSTILCLFSIPLLLLLMG